MSAMTYELNQMQENASITEALFAVTITAKDGKHVPTVIIVTDALDSAQEEEARQHLWGIAEILRNAQAANPTRSCGNS